MARGPEEAPAPCDPNYRVEDMFMCGAMLGRAYRISGDTKYAELLARFLIDGGDVQDGSGLFKHARSAPHFWSRGNGFAALGYAEALTYLPQGPARERAAGEASEASGRTAASATALGDFRRVGGRAGARGVSSLRPA